MENGRQGESVNDRQTQAVTEYPSGSDWTAETSAEIWSRSAKDIVLFEPRQQAAPASETQEGDKLLERKPNSLRTPENIEEAANRWGQLVNEGLGDTAFGKMLSQFGRQVLTENVNSDEMARLIRQAGVSNPKIAEMGLARLNNYLSEYGFQLEVGIMAGGLISHVTLREQLEPGKFRSEIRVDSLGKMTPSIIKIDDAQPVPNIDKRPLSAKEAASYMGEVFFDSVCP